MLFRSYFPPEVPSLPAFMVQRAVSSAIRDYARDYWTGTVYTTNRRIWEHDENFKEYLKKTRAMAVDMETATLFSCGFANHIPTGALLLVSDQPMIPEGVQFNFRLSLLNLFSQFCYGFFRQFRNISDRFNIISTGEKFCCNLNFGLFFAFGTSTV